MDGQRGQGLHPHHPAQGRDAVLGGPWLYRGAALCDAPSVTPQPRRWTRASNPTTQLAGE